MIAPAGGDQLTVVGVSLSLFGLLLSSGAVTYFLRLGGHLKSLSQSHRDTENKVNDIIPKFEDLQNNHMQTRAIATDAQDRVGRLEPTVGSLRTDATRMSTLIDTIIGQMSKLDKVDTMAAIMEELKGSVVPRPEHERQWISDNRRFERLEADLRLLSTPVVKVTKDAD